MRKLPMEIEKFSELENQLTPAGYWTDYINIERVLVESYNCPNKKCRQSLEYKSFANVREHRAYGVCRDCDHAHLFWTESSQLANLKNEISRRASLASARV